MQRKSLKLVIFAANWIYFNSFLFFLSSSWTSTAATARWTSNSFAGSSTSEFYSHEKQNCCRNCCTFKTLFRPSTPSRFRTPNSFSMLLVLILFSYFPVSTDPFSQYFSSAKELSLWLSTCLFHFYISQLYFIYLSLWLNFNFSILVFSSSNSFYYRKNSIFISLFILSLFFLLFFSMKSR